jgi:hypothetical protein
MWLGFVGIFHSAAYIGSIANYTLLAYNKLSGIHRGPGIRPVHLRISESGAIPGTTKQIGGQSGTWQFDAWYRRVSQAPLGRSKTWQGSPRRTSDYFITTFRPINRFWLMTLYDKDEAVDLTPKEKKALRGAVEAELNAHEAKRIAREKRLRRTW